MTRHTASNASNSNTTRSRIFALAFIGLMFLLAPIAAHAATFTVTNTNDFGAGSFRQALINADATIAADTISFNIAGSGVHTINVFSQLPTINNPLTIDGTTQPGYASAPLIELNGAPVGGSATRGLYILNGVVQIKALVINRFTGNAIEAKCFSNCSDATNTLTLTVTGCYIGTNAAGTSALPNTDAGIVISGLSANGTSVIGGTSAAARNVISGNGTLGIYARGTFIKLLIEGNYIGTSADGMASIGNTNGGIDMSVTGNLGDVVIGGSNSAARNIISGNGGDGITLPTTVGTFGGSGVLIEGNYIGTNVNGNAALGNNGNGIHDNGDTNTIGGAFSGTGNVISGNALNGIFVDGIGGDVIQTNHIGTNASGTAALPNHLSGIALNSDHNTVGEAGVNTLSNIISGNDGDGVAIYAVTALKFNGQAFVFVTTGGQQNTVSNNFIGTNPNNAQVGNGGNGVHIYDGASDNLVGGGSTGGNTIANNLGDGVNANVVSNDSDVPLSLNNTISANPTYNNGGLGIDLGTDGVNANDANDIDAGPNGLQNFPILTQAFSNTIYGTLNSKPNTQYTIDFFRVTAADASGNGEGQFYLDSKTVMTDANGNATFSDSQLPIFSGQIVTATATAPAPQNFMHGSTSEFSNCQTVGSLPGALSFSTTNYAVNENAGTATIIVTRGFGTSGTISVDYATSNGTATSGSDYNATSGTLVFADGVTSQSFNVNINDDTFDEPNETVNLTLSNPTGGTTIGTGTSTLTINDDDPLPSMTISNVSQSEGNSGATNFVFNVALSAASGQTVTVDYATSSAGGTATANSDYQPASGTLTFTSGQTTKTITVAVNGDVTNEIDETFSVTLTNAVNASVTNATGIGTILNDDSPGTLAFTTQDFSASEGAPTANITVARTGGAAGTVSIHYATVGGTATAGSDYTATNGTLTWLDGESGSKTFNVAITNDAQLEVNETVNLLISNALGGATIGNPNNASLTILDNDGTPTIIISEFRERGANGALDEFVELFNNGNDPVTVAASDDSDGWAIVSSDGVVRFVIPNGKVIPARGHFLATNSDGYSLRNYGGLNAARGNVFYTGDIPDNASLALFTTASLANRSLATRIDAVGFAGVGDSLYFKGNGLTQIGGGDGEYSFVRRIPNAPLGIAQDTGDNAADFAFISTTGANFGGVDSALGTPGPENLSSPIAKSNLEIAPSFVDPTVAQSVAPNRVRDFTPVPNGPAGTFIIRRAFTNNTGAPVTRLRFRVVDVTTLNNTAGVTGAVADLRPLSSTDTTVSVLGSTVIVKGTTVEQLASQSSNMGGLNSTMSAGSVTLATPLAPDAQINVQFLLGVQQSGKFHFFVNTEALP